MNIGGNTSIKGRQKATIRTANTKFVNVYSNDFFNMVDNKKDDDDEGSFDFTTTDATTETIENLNDKSWRVLAFPP